MKLTIEAVSARCIEDGACLIWTCGTSSDGSPCAGCGRKTIRLRRWVWEHFRGPLQAGMNVTMNGPRGCCNPLCLNIEHMLPVTRRRQMQIASERGLLMAGPERIANQQRLKRSSQQAKLDDEKVNEIRRRRASGETLVSLAKAFGVHLSLIQRISANKAWRRHVANSSVFTMRA